ncbi:MAG: PadR family transcriptional regulator [Roseiflexaceae bacterium]|jgi:DNA-binding PadR family transcriptional regulator|nr:PadR family transcriptional regulator [Chloroflexaceae bacterium]
MPRKDALTNGELNDSQFYILAALIEPHHGYAVMQMLMQVDSQTVHIGPATLYTTLRQLVDAGLLERCTTDGTNKVYVITAEGRMRLSNEIARKQAMVEFAKRALKGNTSDEQTVCTI